MQRRLESSNPVAKLGLGHCETLLSISSFVEKESFEQKFEPD